MAIRNPRENERRFEKSLISDYLEYGSVDEVFKKHRYSLPISYPSYQRLINKWGVVKAAGPNTNYSEVVSFLMKLAIEKIPLERLYRKMPPSFKTSISTLHRVLRYVKKGITRRMATTLLLSPEDSPNMVLVGNDISTPRIDYGKPYGAISTPTGFSKADEPASDAILRVLQQEVFTQQAIEKNMPQIFTDDVKPILYLDIVDVRVSVYHLSLPERLTLKSKFSSFKLRDHRFVHLNQLRQSEIDGEVVRAGIKDAAVAYQKNLNNVKAELNQQLELALL